MSLAVNATGLLTYTATDATDGKVVTVGTQTYTLKTGALTAAGHVKIAAGEPDKTARNLVYAVNALGGTPGTDYYAIGANGSARATLDAVLKLIRFDSRLSGAAGNAVAVTSNETEFTAPGSLAGGIDGTSLIAWSLVTMDEAKIALRVRGASADEEIVGILAEVEALVFEEIGFRAVAEDGEPEPEEDIDEYHDLPNPQGFIYVRRRPVRTLTAVYLGGVVMPADQYTLDSRSGMIAVLSAGITRPIGGLLGAYRPLSGPFMNFPEDVWRYGVRYFPAGQSMARVLYKGGWADTASVNPGLKSIALDMVARLYRTRERKSQGVTSEVAQGLATATKYDPRVVSDELRARLRHFKTLTQTARE